MKTSRKTCIGLLTVMFVIQGCAHLDWRPTPSEEEKAQYGTIGIVKANYLPELKFDAFAVGISAGAWKGAGEGALNTINSLCQGGGREAGVLVCALGIALSPVGAVIGSVDGANKAVPEEKSREIKDKMRETFADLKIQEVMVEHILKNCNRLTDYHFVLLSEGGPSAFDKIPDYRSLYAKGIHTVLEVTVHDIGFLGGEGKDPFISFFMDVRARLIRTEDNREIISLTQFMRPEEHSYISIPRNIAEWAKNDARLLHQELESCYKTLADEIVDTAFLELATPTKSTMEKLSSWPDRYKLGTLSPKVTWNFMSNKRTLPKVGSLRPKLVWESFPTDLQRQKDGTGRLSKVNHITYELKIWEAEGDFPLKLVYFRQGLTESSHEVEKTLEPSTTYYWSVRARFTFDGRSGVTAGAYPNRPSLYYEGFVTPVPKVQIER